MATQKSDAEAGKKTASNSTRRSVKSSAKPAASSHVHGNLKALIIYLFLTAVIFYSGYLQYNSFIEKKRFEMENVANEIATNFSDNLTYAESVLNYINRQISGSNATEAEIKEILSSFNSVDYGYDSIKDVLSAGMFYWVDNKRNLVASSQGNLSAPVNLSDRDYIKNAEKRPWRICTGLPIVGAMSGQYVIPAGVGVVGKGGKYLGTTLVSFKLYELTEKYQALTSYYGTDFAILTNNNQVLMESASGLFSEDRELISRFKFFKDYPAHEEMIAEFNPLEKEGNYMIIRNITKYPYKILISYQNEKILSQLFRELLPRLLEFIAATAAFLVFRRK